MFEREVEPSPQQPLSRPEPERPSHPQHVPDDTRGGGSDPQHAVVVTDQPDQATVVVGVDGSAQARAALRWAVRHARDIGATVHAIAVWHRPIQFADSMPVPVPEFEAEARRWLADALPTLSADEVRAPIETSVEEGDPARHLLDHADNAELLVLGNRGRSPATGALVGSVALRCAHYARCPVVLVPGAEEAAPR